MSSAFGEEEDGLEQEVQRARMLYVERRLRVLRGEEELVALTTTAEEMQQTVKSSLARTALLAVGYCLLAIVLLMPTEEWSAADCAYFAIVTLTTVGYGDLSPSTDAGKIVSMLLSVGGLVIVTSSLTQLIEAFVRQRNANAVAASLQRLDDTTSLIQEANLTSSAGSGGSGGSGDSGGRGGSGGSWSGSGSGVGRGHASRAGGGGIAGISLVGEWMVTATSLLHDVRNAATATTRRCATRVFGLAGANRLVQLMSSVLWVLQTASPLLAAIAGGACLGYFAEGWTLLDSVYYSVISLLTVGYGDFSPVTRAGRTVCTLCLPVACAASLRSISRLGSAIDYGGKARSIAPSSAGGGGRDGRAKVTDERIERMHQMLSAAVGGEDGLITEADFLCTSLLEMELVEPEILKKVREQFYRLDRRAAGFLSMAGYRAMLTSTESGAKGRWRYAAAATMQEQRVLRRLRAFDRSFGMRDSEGGRLSCGGGASGAATSSEANGVRASDNASSASAFMC